MEEHSIIGGIGSVVCEILADNNKTKPIKRIAIADKDFSGMGYGDRDWMHSKYGLDVASITRTIMNWMRDKGTSKKSS
jgi:transketolase C-terminal domain/subunit